MPNKTYQIQIALQGFKPKIWRRILVSSDTLLPNFHDIIQNTMGWDDSHPHQFIVGRTCYADASDSDDQWDDLGQVDYTGVRLHDVLKKEKDRIVYEYDFGDGWMHDIMLEKILPLDTSVQLPICLAGGMNCPAEDSGGVPGYTEYLKIRSDPSHEEYESVMEWLGEDFDPEYFNMDKINRRLGHRKRRGNHGHRLG